MWVGFGVGFMVIGFADESVLLVGRGGGGGPTVVEGICVSWEVEGTRWWRNGFRRRGRRGKQTQHNTTQTYTTPGEHNRHDDTHYSRTSPPPLSLFFF
jgi:hypothetical protein